VQSANGYPELHADRGVMFAVLAPDPFKGSGAIEVDEANARVLVH
jgi:hypothetical protein